MRWAAEEVRKIMKTHHDSYSNAFFDKERNRLGLKYVVRVKPNLKKYR